MVEVVILEAAQDVDDRVDLTDVAEELVAQPLALARAAHQPGDVDEAELGFDNLGRAGDPGELVEPRIGDRDVADIGLDRSEEHTSEVQSIMRHSYSVFCLKKQTTQSDSNKKT